MTPADDPVPLLPWLHSTETCEHVFGELQKLLKEFMYLDFLYSVLKLQVLMRLTLMQHTAHAKSHAKGYAHTWFGAKDMDFVALSTYPLNEEIAMAAVNAYDAAKSLWAFLDIMPLAFMSGDEVPPVRLPGLEHLLFEDDQEEHNAQSDSDEELGEFTYLQQLIDGEEQHSLCTHNIEKSLDALTFAAIVASVDDTMCILNLRDNDDEDLVEDFSCISDALAACQKFPPIDAADECQYPSDRMLVESEQHDYSAPVAIRAAHQT
ncbi:hypothetical protein K439DRAFT_1625238 [Ramaria rubella]|nr:hypothetical protein K439DRAFT_1625238 [Ramaria rubella]